MDTVVIDIDGTLLDSNYHHTLAWFRAFQRKGYDVPAWLIHRHIGMGGDRLVGAVSSDEVEERHGDELRELWEDEYDDVSHDTPALAGARELLAGLRERGLKVVLASSGIPRFTEHALEVLDAEEHADGWTTSEDAEESKPDPELLDKALEKVEGHEAFVIGDSVWDVEAARARGLPVVVLLTGGYGRDELLAAGATAVHRDPADLLAHLDGLLADLAG